jgi:hypothetical protein
MQLCTRIYYSKVYWRLNMFRAAHRPSSGAMNSICSLWLIYPFGDRPLSWQRPITTWIYKPEAANAFQSSWWWAVCHSKHAEPSINFEIINSITKLHLVGISTGSSTMHGSMNIKVVTLFCLTEDCESGLADFSLLPYPYPISQSSL